MDIYAKDAEGLIHINVPQALVAAHAAGLIPDAMPLDAAKQVLIEEAGRRFPGATKFRLYGGPKERGVDAALGAGAGGRDPAVVIR